MPSQYQPVEVRIKQAGALMTNDSTDEVGISNFIECRDFRRYLERLLTREGHDYFFPNTNIAIGEQPFPYGPGTDIALSGVWGSGSHSRDVIPVHKGWTYKWIRGTHETGVANGTEAVTTSPREFQAQGDTVTVQGIPLEAKGYQLIEYQPITLVHMARRPNGKTAVIVGSPTTLYRYFGLEDGAYFEGTGSNSYFEEPPAANAPYFDDDPGIWVVIGSGYDPDAQRWEALSINGWSIFNNGADLPTSYRVEDLTVTPLYELRESGIASVGCIAEFSGILMLGDISEIQDEPLSDLFDKIGQPRSGAIMASITSFVATATSDIFSPNDVFRHIVFDDGTEASISAFTNPKTVAVSSPPSNVSTQRFRLLTKAAQTGSDYSGLITGTQLNGAFTVAASAPIFAPGDVTKRLRFLNGFSATITVFTNNQNVTVDTAATADFTGIPFYIIDLPEQASPDYIVTALAPIFDAGMVGRKLSWVDGTEKLIVGFIDSKHVYVDTDYAVASDFIGIENPVTYANFDKKEFINRIQYRIMWSMPEAPTRFSPVFLGTIQAGESTLTLEAPAKSIAIGDVLLITGAGAAGGNLTATVLFVAASQVITLDQPAETTIQSQTVFKNDAVSSIVGFFDLQDDSSGIIRMLELQGELVIYKDTAIATARYTADVSQPFAFLLKRVPATAALFYRNTLISVKGAFHLYAGRSSFYTFDLVNRFPTEDKILELCKDRFFANARLEDTRWIFAADNVLTKEIVFSTFPYSSSVLDRLLCYDYFNGVASTSSARISAAGSVKRPEATLSAGETRDWFVMATPVGAVLIYGFTAAPEEALGGSNSIYYRRELNPYDATKIGYQGRRRTGMGSFGVSFLEKDIRSLVLLLSSFSRGTQVTWDLYAVRNVAETSLIVATKVFANPESENLMPVFFRQNYFGERVTVDILDNPIEIVAVLWEVSGVGSESDIRLDI